MTKMSTFFLIIASLLIFTNCSKQISLHDSVSYTSIPEYVTKPQDVLIVNADLAASRKVIVSEFGLNWPAMVKMANGEIKEFDAFDLNNDGQLELIISVNEAKNAKVIFKSHDGTLLFNCTGIISPYSKDGIEDEHWLKACDLKETASYVKRVNVGTQAYQELVNLFQEKFKESIAYQENLRYEIFKEKIWPYLKTTEAAIDIATLVAIGANAKALFSPHLYSKNSLKLLWAIAYTASQSKNLLYSLQIYPYYWKGHLGNSTPSRFEVHDMIRRYIETYYPGLKSET